ncbi:Nucleolar protein 58 [Porphyridium purpureum]|uniref:Nucleolar protein 58 n=1 Tax=Porphyridium purpureum TaxID=35688 RepID=A0A5J4YVX3_PORPP|nr:Nucleolar protein 58 [Porphyridium purpureum]|eukprot:POR9065..scf209_3
MFVLFETAGGHALFKVTDEKKLFKVVAEDDAVKGKRQGIESLLALSAFGKFEDTVDALSASTAIVEGQLSKQLKKLVKKNVPASEKLLVSDPKLGGALKESLSVACVFDSSVMEIMREIRANIDTLLEDGDAFSPQEQKIMALGLAHSLSRYKLKFSPDKVDTMIVQAIGLLDDLDKEINTYAMRLREWYGWHFPELSKIQMDNLAYAKVVLKMKIRTAAQGMDFSDCVAPEVEEEIKQAAEISMGTEISDEDILNITALAAQVATLVEYRATLFEYLQNRMNAIAPNLSMMVGELVGARLIAHAGSLMSLAKYPASTIQILGAEKALFRALKTKHATPKYGLIYHASLVGQAPQKLKGKISRVLAAKCALSVRADALCDDTEDPLVGREGREKVENRLRQLEQRQNGFMISKQNKRTQVSNQKVTGKRASSGPAYNADADLVRAAAPRNTAVEDIISGDEEPQRKKAKKEKKEKKDKEKKPKELEEEAPLSTKGKRRDDDETKESEKKKKKKKEKE